MAIEVVLPKVDMDMDSGTIAAWRVAEGDLVRQGDVLFEMETDKSVMEVEAPASGRIRDLAAITGEPVAVGTRVAWIDEKSEREPLRATPLARKQAKERGVALETIAGSGPRGRIVASDVEASSTGRLPAPSPRDAPADAVVPFTPVRRIVAQRLAESARTIPHFHLTAHIEMTALRASLERHASAVESAAGVRPTLTMLLVKRVADVLVVHPGLNASVEGEAARLHAQIHIGVAMDREGDLLVPVLRDASTRSLAQLAAEFARLKSAVRERTIAPSDLRGSTFTLSNLGMYGVDAFTAIINPPECAILAIGRTVDTPVGRDGRIVLRPMATFTLSSDHRIVDGAAAGRFMADLRRAIEDPDL